MPSTTGPSAARNAVRHDPLQLAAVALVLESRPQPTPAGVLDLYEESHRRFVEYEERATRRIARLIRADSWAVVAFPALAAVATLRLDAGVAVLACTAVLMVGFAPFLQVTTAAGRFRQHLAPGSLCGLVVLIGVLAAGLATHDGLSLMALVAYRGELDLPAIALLCLLWAAVFTAVRFPAVLVGASLLARAREAGWTRRGWPARDATIVSLGRCLVLLRRPHPFQHPREVRRVQRELRAAARLLAEGLPRRLAADGVRLTRAGHENFLEAGRAVAELVDETGSSTHDTADRTIDVLVVALIATLEGQYGELPRRDRRSASARRARLVGVVRTLLGGLVPAIGLLLAEALPLSIPPFVAGWWLAMALAWPVVAVVDLVDPGWRVRMIAFAEVVASLWRESPKQ